MSRSEYKTEIMFRAIKIARSAIKNLTKLGEEKYRYLFGLPKYFAFYGSKTISSK